MSDNDKKLFEGLQLVENDRLNDWTKAGVWALFGQKKNHKDDEKWYCLQVGATNNIKNEISKNIKLLEKKELKKEEEVSYINYFGKELFKFTKCPSSRDYLYIKYINEHFDNIKFFVICTETDAQTRKNIEKEFAVRTKSICWRNGRPYKHCKKVDYELEINKIIDNGDYLNENIKSFIDRFNVQK